MSEERKINITHSSGFAWFAGWLFITGYLELGFWRGLIGLVVWPHFLGGHFAP